MDPTTHYSQSHEQAARFSCPPRIFGAMALSTAFSLALLKMNTSSNASFLSPPLNGVPNLAVCILVLAYIVSTAWLYHLNKGHQYRLSFLFTGVIAGMSIGLMAKMELQDCVVKIMPGCVLVAMVVCAVLHRYLWREWEETPEVEEDRDDEFEPSLW